MILKYLARSYVYVRRAYTVISMPTQLLAYTALIDYEVITRINWLFTLFPNYISFLKTSILLVIGLVAIGYIYTKKTNLVREDIEIATEVNPYMNYKIPRVQVPSYAANIQLCKIHGIDTTKMEKILENSL